MTASPDVAVQKVRNLAPVFNDEDDDTAGIQVKPRQVPENSPAATVVTLGDSANPAEDPVDATDGADAEMGDDNSILYLLSGADAASFGINSATGQIMVGASAKLDHETKDTYEVTVTARDPEGLNSSIDVTIKVTDVNEAPEISGSSSEMFPENGDGVVATFTADDPEGESVMWSVETNEGASPV